MDIGASHLGRCGRAWRWPSALFRLVSFRVVQRHSWDCLAQVALTWAGHVDNLAILVKAGIVAQGKQNTTGRP